MSDPRQAVLTVVGAGVGFLASGGNPMGAITGAQIGYGLGSTFINTNLPPQEGPRLDDFKVQVSEYGSPLSRSWGTVRNTGIVIWSSEIEETEHVDRQTQSAKSGPSVTTTTTTYTYSVSFALAFNDGEIDDVRRIWLHDELVYDASNLSDYGVLTVDELSEVIATKTVSLTRVGQVEIYKGTETQEPDPTIESYEGVGEVPAFRGTAYLVFTDLQLERYGNRRPNVLVEYVRASPPAAGSEILRTIDYTDIRQISGSSFQAGVTCFEDDGTAHAFMGNWSFAASGAGSFNYYKIFPSGSWSFIKKTGTADRRGLTGTSARVPAVPRTEKGTSIAEPNGAIHDYDTQVVYGLDSTGMPSHSGGYYREGMAQVGNQVEGTWAYMATESGSTKIRLFFYEKSISVDLFFPETEVSHTTFDIDVAGDVYTWCLTESYLYVLIKGGSPGPNGLYQYDHEGNQLHYFAGATMDNTAADTWATVDRGDENQVYWGSGGDYIHYNVTTGVETTYANACNCNRTYSNNIMVNGGVLYEDDRAASEINIIALDSVSRTGELLSNIVAELSQMAGQTSSQYDVTALAGITVYGYTFGTGQPAAAIQQLMAAYQFSSYSDENKIIYKLRKSSANVTVAEDDLGAGVGSPNSATLPYKRMDDQNLPKAVVVHHIDYEMDYARGAQPYRRIGELVRTEQTVQVELPIVMTASKARQIAEIVLNSLYVGRTEYGPFTLPLSYADIVPTDVLSVPSGSLTHEIRVNTVSIGDVVEITGTANDQASYDSTVTGEVPTQTYTGAAYPGPTELYLLNLPALRNQDSDDGFYIAAHGYFPSWDGCTVYAEGASGAFSQVASVIGSTTAAVAIDALADGVSTTIDYQNTFRVRMRNGTPTSSTKAGILADPQLNAIAVGVNGRWELMQFITATYNSSNETYTLSGLLRGLRGTEFAMDQHAEDDLVIWLDPAVMTRASAPDINTTYTYRAVSFTQSFQDGVFKTFSNTARATKPLSPVHVKVSDAGGGNVDVTWVRRGRIWGEWRDLADVPISEVNEEYTVNVIESDQTTVASTTTVTSESATVAASSGQYIQVAQNSDFYGVGEYADLVPV